MASAKTPLPVLMAHVLNALKEDYNRARNEVPPLPYLLNLLRVLAPDGTDIKQLPALARLSKRAVRMSTQLAEKRGWLTIESIARGQKHVTLTRSGDALRKAGAKRLKATELAWHKRFGADGVQQLRGGLTGLVNQLDLELPHYPSGYGLEDNSIHGGNYAPGQKGPPRIPAHGEEWTVVIREQKNAAQLPITSQLSQALCAFCIDYDGTAESSIANLNSVLSYLRHFPEEGLPLAEANALGGVKGTGRTLLERHKLVAVEDGLARLTGHGIRVRDRFPERVAEIESDWSKRYGAACMRNLRRALETFDERIDSEPPDVVDVCGWLRRRP